MEQEVFDAYYDYRKIIEQEYLIDSHFELLSQENIGYTEFDDLLEKKS